MRSQCGRWTVLLAGEEANRRLQDLLASPMVDVRVLTRDPALGEVLRRLGAAVFPGGMDDPASLRRAMRACHAVWAAPAGEVEAKNVIRVAAGADVEMLAMLSTGDDDRLRSYARGLGIEVEFFRPGTAPLIDSPLPLFF